MGVHNLDSLGTIDGLRELLAAKANNASIVLSNGKTINGGEQLG